MKFTWKSAWLLITVAALFTDSAPAHGAPQGVAPPKGPPDWIAGGDREPGRPLWVSEQKVKKGEGGFDWSLFTPLEQQLIATALQNYERMRARGQVGRPEDPCAGMGPTFAHYVVERPSIDELIEHSEAIFSGTVEGGKPGLYGSSPTTVYSIRVEKLWKGDGAATPGDIAYLAHPDTAIAVGDAWLCGRSIRHPDRPLANRRVLVFSHKAPGSKYPIYDPIDEELFLETSTGLSAPRHLEEALASTTFDELVDQLTQRLGPPETTP